MKLKLRRERKIGGMEPIGKRINEWIRFYLMKINYSYKQKEKLKKEVEVKVKTKGSGGEESKSTWFSNGEWQNEATFFNLI